MLNLFLVCLVEILVWVCVFMLGLMCMVVWVIMFIDVVICFSVFSLLCDLRLKWLMLVFSVLVIFVVVLLILEKMMCLGWMFVCRLCYSLLVEMMLVFNLCLVISCRIVMLLFVFVV